MINVLIGIQARSTSHRLPGKCFEMIGHKTMLRHVIDSCNIAADYINNWNTKKIEVKVCVCIPISDDIKQRKYSGIELFEGPEHDVLKRYALMSEKYQPDYIVRITADCPLIPPFLISKCITTGVLNDYDYCSNVDERCRTSSDGFDCEVFSKRLLAYADKTAETDSDREHVTLFMRQQCHMPEFRFGTIINFLDASQIKLSVDNPEDLERVRNEYLKMESVYKTAQALYGKDKVHRF